MRSVIMRTARLALVLAAVAVAAPASAQVRADATGRDAFTTADYWGVNFLGGSGSIQFVRFDLTGDGDAFFDFDGGTSFANAVAPVLGALVGLNAADITWSFSTFVGGNVQHPAVLTFTFAAGSFSAGDSFRFGADTDFLFSDPTPGSAIAAGGAVFSVTLEGGTTGSAPFGFVSAEESEAVVNLAAVPEPATLLLAGSGLAVLGLAGLRRRTR